MADPLDRKGLLLKADPIAAAFREEVRLGLEKCTRHPKLVGILSTSSSPSNNYAEFTRRQCEELGVEFVLKKTGAALSPDLSEGEGVEEAIIEANEDASVNGIMVIGKLFFLSCMVYLMVTVQGLFSNLRTSTG